MNARGQVAGTLSCAQLHRKAERLAALLLERDVQMGSHVAVLLPSGLDLVRAVYGCLYAGCVPIAIRPPSSANLSATLATCRLMLEVSQTVAVLSDAATLKLLRSKEAAQLTRGWPSLIDIEETPRRTTRFQRVRPPTDESPCYMDLSVNSNGSLVGVRVSHLTVANLCRAQKLQCELYPSRDVALSLDPYSGLGFVLWSLSSVYAGHHSILIPAAEVEASPSIFVHTVSQYRVRDAFCSYGVMELSTRGLSAADVDTLRTQRGVSLAGVRSLVVVAEERPRIQLIGAFTRLFGALGLSARALSASFGCRANVAIALQSASSGPEPSIVYVDARALREDRIALVDKGAPHALCLLECGSLMPSVRVAVVEPNNASPCADSQLGEVWVASTHNSDGFFVNLSAANGASCNNSSNNADSLRCFMSTGDTQTAYARTGYCGFIRRTELRNIDGEPHDALFVVGSLDETLLIRSLRYHPIDIENTIVRVHRRIVEAAVFVCWQMNLLVAVVEFDGAEQDALDMVPLVTNCVLEEHQLVVAVVVIVDPGAIPINSRGEKQRIHLRDAFLADQLDPIYVAYNM